jgi:ADP-heptose:LPS heptosyltransferase
VAAGKILQLYRQLRHGTRVRTNFIRNYFRLKRQRFLTKKENPTRRLVAVMLLEHLGDIVACEPVARYVKEKDPDAYIVWGVKNVYRELIDSNPYIDMTLVVHCLSERLLLENTGLFDETIDLHFSDRYCSLCRMPLKKKGDSPIGLTTYFNHGSILSSFSKSAGLPPLDETPRVYIPVEAVQHVNSLHLPERFIVINCTSNNIQKDWPAEKWMELTEKIVRDYSLPVVEVGGLPLIFRNGNPKYIDLCRKLSILESAEVIRRAVIFIGTDSGPAHLANAVRTPGVILMGSYLQFTKYTPFSGSYANGEGAEIVYSEGPIVHIPVDKVLAVVSKMIDSTPKRTAHAI